MSTVLSIKVAGLTATGTYDDEVAIAVMEEVVIATEGPVEGTPQERLDWIIQYIANHLTEVAVGNMRRREASEAKRKAEEAEAGLRLITPAEPAQA